MFAPFLALHVLLRLLLVDHVPLDITMYLLPAHALGVLVAHFVIPSQVHVSHVHGDSIFNLLAILALTV